MKVKTKDLIDEALDFAVAKCLNPDWDDEDLVAKVTSFDEFSGELWNFSTDWAQGGPIIEMTEITLDLTDVLFDHITDSAILLKKPEWWASKGNITGRGPTPLVAAMRCYVAYNFGNEIEIPEELK